MEKNTDTLHAPGVVNNVRLSGKTMSELIVLSSVINKTKQELITKIVEDFFLDLPDFKEENNNQKKDLKDGRI